MNPEQLIDSLKYNVHRLKRLESKVPSLELQLKELSESIIRDSSDLDTVVEASLAYKQAQDILYESSIGALEELMNACLSYVFFDKDYKVSIVVDDKRGVKNLEFFLTSDGGSNVVAVKKSVGNGVRSVLSFILHSFTVITKGGDILILDEKYSFISEQYVGRFFSFVLSLAEEKNLKVVMITHDERFHQYATKTYKVFDGEVSELKTDV